VLHYTPSLLNEKFKSYTLYQNYISYHPSHNHNQIKHDCLLHVDLHKLDAIDVMYIVLKWPNYSIAL